MEPRVQIEAMAKPIIGVSPAAEEMRAFARKAAQKPYPILLRGETGVGKEQLAAHIHELGGASRPFVQVDCGAIPKELIETELFGYVRGAFTGSLGDKDGLVERAEDGTLFLDEIHNLSYNLQSRLLRLVEARKYRKVGSTADRHVRTRIIAGTNIDLIKAVRKKKFRSDLFFRLNVLPHVIPPLRERREDIPVLAEYFLDQIEPPKSLSAAALSAITAYSWPGNVRELYMSLVRGNVNADLNPEIGLEHVAPYFEPSLNEEDPAAKENAAGELPTFDELKESYFQDVWAAAGGVSARAAEIAGISRAAMRHYAKKYRLMRQAD